MKSDATRARGAVPLDELKVGELLAEGGEGRVYELPVQPHLVFKAYRRPLPREILDELVAWPSTLPPACQPRVQAAAAWPAAVVEDRGSAVGLLLPRAARRFALRHRDGTTRLASLSYLTADPAHRAVAYGLKLPVEGSSARFGLVYALARLLEAFESAPLRVAHGDLSAKNVLWSLQRGPEVFVIDCDNSERFACDSSPAGQSGRRRAMTPNWEDPAVPAGHNPGVDSDRYSLALIFLRVVGAANFPVQARQRAQPAISVDFAVPPALLAHPTLAPGAAIWDLCRRGLSIQFPDQRPDAAAWVAALEAVLDDLGGADVIETVWANQGGGARAFLRPGPGLAAAPDVVIRPVARASPRPEPRLTPVPRESRGGGYHSVGTNGSPRQAGPPATEGGGPPAAIFAQSVAAVGRVMRWWTAAHRRSIGSLTTAGQRAHGARLLAFCAAVDLLAVVAGLFVAAMIVAPITGV